ncbi:TlpA disulfide reductase family protein [Mucilaginibacter ginsenosidivorax]|uniref:AhpC/TSA family protein n=1 Tax=Mucilaginibacter ginsenosidivorax TaxID=862126 RepID=A0A5B8VXQ6_9SPHI|nr:TlpA disulfide reductase family protein [Mucilaginibacter ginsenosidivorax]QEC76360.1 AhpC/TSA family protein [Mucilaginibacter ginsenosidivorax]
MKKIILLALAALPVVVFAQDNKYDIQGKIGDFNAPAKVYLEYRFPKGKPIYDSCTVVNGKFHFAGSVGAAPLNAYLLFNSKGTGTGKADGYRAIYLEPGLINVNAADKIENATVDGPKTNQENEKYQLAQKPVNDAYNALEERQKAATAEQKASPEYLKKEKADEKAIDELSAATDKKFIRENPNSIISLNALESLAYSTDYADLKPLYDVLTPAVKSTDAGKALGERMPKLKAVALGAVAPEFAEADTSGKVINLSSFRGQYVLIDFWASWCGPCRRENPNVVKAYNHYKGQKFTILGVSLDKPNAKDKWLAAIHKDGLTWTHVSDLKFWDSKAAGLYAVRGIPQNFLLDPNGKIIAKNLRGDDLEDKLAEIFGKI